MIILPCPSRPDLDCIASSIAYARLLVSQGKPAKAWLCGTPDAEADFYLKLFPELSLAEKADFSNVTGFICVDYSRGDFLPDEVDRNKVIEVIDHRMFHHPETDFPNASIQLDDVGAAATQITERFMQAGLVPDRDIATMLYGAIYSNTLCLRGAICTERDRQAVLWLKKIHPEADHYLERQMDARRQEVIEFFPDILLTEMKTEDGTFGRYGISQLEITKGMEFWNEYKDRIVGYFGQYDYPVFLNIIDLTTNRSVLYFTHQNPQEKLRELVQIEQCGNHVILLQPALLRKQIIPLLV